MADTRRKDVPWSIPTSGLEWIHVQVAILMDIRDELKNLNRIFGCPNFIDMPRQLRRVAINTKKRKCVRKVKVTS